MTKKRAILLLMVFILAFSQSACVKQTETSETEILSAESAGVAAVETIPEEFLGYVVPEINYDNLGSIEVSGPGFSFDEYGWRSDTEEEFRARSAEEQYQYAEMYRWFKHADYDDMPILYHYMDAADKGCSAALTGAAALYFSQELYGDWLPGCYYWSTRAIEAGEVGDAQFYLGYCYYALGKEYQDKAEVMFVTACDNGGKMAAYYLRDMNYSRGNYSEAAKYDREYIEGVCEKRLDATYTDWFGKLPEEDIVAYAGIWYNDSCTFIQLYSNGFCKFGYVTDYSAAARMKYEVLYGREFPYSPSNTFGSWQVENGYVVIETRSNTDGFLPGNYCNCRYYFEKDGDQLVFRHVECEGLSAPFQVTGACDLGAELCAEPTSFRKMSPVDDDGYSGLYISFSESALESRVIQITCLNGVYLSCLWTDTAFLNNGQEEYAYPAENGSYMTLTKSDYGATYRFFRVDDYYYQLDIESSPDNADTSSLFYYWPPLTRVASFW